MDDCTDLEEFVLGLASGNEIWFGRVLGLG